MTERDVVDRVADALAADPDEFEAAVAREVEELKGELHLGTFDNPQAIVGLEHELYAVEEEGCHLTRIPRRVLSYVRLEKELGLHNAELHTSPHPLNRYGLAAQGQELRSYLQTALTETATEGIRLVSDGMWTIPPRNESAREYLADSVAVEVDDATDGVPEEGVRIATNMSESVRYHAMSNASGVDYEPKLRVRGPHVDFEGRTVLLESLITSIQPHYQVPIAADLPAYFGYALRVAAPLLALGANSPFFPADLYDEDATAEDVLADGRVENRIWVFETVLNPVDGEDKVRFPEDLGTVEEAVDRIAADTTIVPTGVEREGRFDDRFAHFRHKHGTYWRWVRPVFDGATRSMANARIEFRPIPAQPTVHDCVAFLALFAGLMESLPRHEHPVENLPWETARDDFYAAARDGFDADVRWITADGEETTDVDRIYAELFGFAREGLEARGVPPETVQSYLGPLQERVDRRTSPADWKRRRVRERVEAGDDLASAIAATQTEYVERQTDTLLEGDFASWLGGD